ncbi:hypothetical protein MILU53160_10440 [Micrococcus luteus]
MLIVVGPGCRGAVLGGAPHLLQQPVPQPRRGDAVIPVVVLDVGADRPRDLGVPGLHRGDVPVVLGDAVRRRRHAVLRPVLRPHVEGLQLLDGVARHTGPQGGADRGVEVHEQPRAQPVVQLALAHAVAHGQAFQRGDLVRGVVVDPHPRVGRASRLHERHELLEGRPLGGTGVRPQTREPEVGRGGARGVPARRLDPAPQVLEALHAPVRGDPQRVPLEVEEDVSGVRRRQPHHGARVHDPMRRQPVRPGRLQLDRRLLPQRLPRAAGHALRRCDGHRELLDGRDAGLAQPGALQPRGPRREQHVPVLGDGLLARLTCAADAQAVVAPAGRLPGGHVILQQRLQSGALVPVHRDHLVQVRDMPGTVPEPQAALPRPRHVHAVQQVRVRGDLQQRRHPRMPGQLRVHHLVRTLGVLLVRAEHEEVGQAAERAVVQHPLEHDGGTRGQRRRGALAGGPHTLGRVALRAGEPDHLVRAVLRLEAREHARLVLVPEAGDPLEERVRHADPRGTSELGIHRPAQPPIGTRGGGGDVRGAEHEGGAVRREGHHAVTLDRRRGHDRRGPRTGSRRASPRRRQGGVGARHTPDRT